MPFVVHHPLQHVGKQPVGSQQCAVLPQIILGSMPTVPHWKKGAPVKGNILTPGTVIAVFNSNGDYAGSQFATNVHGRAHTALYVKQTNLGIEVVHQWFGCGTIRKSTIHFGGGANLAANADNYFVVERK